MRMNRRRVRESTRQNPKFVSIVTVGILPSLPFSRALQGNTQMEPFSISSINDHLDTPSLSHSCPALAHSARPALHVGPGPDTFSPAGTGLFHINISNSRKKKQRDKPAALSPSFARELSWLRSTTAEDPSTAASVCGALSKICYENRGGWGGGSGRHTAITFRMSILPSDKREHRLVEVFPPSHLTSLTLPILVFCTNDNVSDVQATVENM